MKPFVGGQFVACVVFVTPDEEPRTANKEDLGARLAGQLAESLSEEVYGLQGLELDCDIDECEDLAVLAARAVFAAVIARALVVHDEELPHQLRCPEYQRGYPNGNCIHRLGSDLVGRVAHGNAGWQNRLNHYN